MPAKLKAPTVRVIGLGPKYASFDLDELTRARHLFAKLADRMDSRVLVLDFSQTAHVGAAMAGLLLQLQGRLRKRGRTLLVAGVRKPLGDLLRLVGFSGELVFANRQAALSAAWRYGRLATVGG